MRLGIMQPYFFPYIGYFSLIKHVDQFVLLDNVQFIRHGWIERNRILKPSGGWQYISVPLKKHAQTTLIKDIVINNEVDWKQKILAQLVHYKKAPYYRTVMQLLKDVFQKEYDTITELNLETIRAVTHFLNIETPIDVFRKMDIKIETVTSADEWALNICKAIPEASEYWNSPGGMTFFDSAKYKENGIELKFERVNITEYMQNKSPFEPGLSILDVMMFNSPEEINRMLDDYELYE